MPNRCPITSQLIALKALVPGGRESHQPDAALAVITADRRIPVLFKAARQSALGVGAGTEILTCGPEFGFVWAKHVAEVDGAHQLRVEQAIHDALFDEFEVEPSEIDSWQIGSLAIQSPHLNAALLGVVTLTLSETMLRPRLARVSSTPKSKGFSPRTNYWTGCNRISTRDCGMQPGFFA